MNEPAALALDVSAVASCQKRWLPSAPSGTPPAARCSHTATQLAGGKKHKFLVVGGGSCTADGEWTHYGDVHEFDAHAQAWTELVPVEGSPLLPPRRGHCAGLYAKRDLLYIFGGVSGGTAALLRNDFWRMRVSERVWEKLPTSGTTPPERRGAMSALSESLGQMWVFGGYIAAYPGFDPGMSLLYRRILSSTISFALDFCTVPNADLICRSRYRFDLVEESWHKESSSGSPPLLALASCTLIQSDGEHPQLVVFGGASCDPSQPHINPLSNDLWLCDLTSARGGVTWSRLQTEGTVPTPRFSHGCAQLHGCLVVFGGTGHTDEHNTGEDSFPFASPETITYADTHILDMRRPIPLWKEALELGSSVAPSARNGVCTRPCVCARPCARACVCARARVRRSGSS